MQKLFLMVLFLFPQVMWAKTLCVCQTDTNPSEIKYYKAGCKLWLMKKSCYEKKMITQDEDLEKLLTPDYEAGSLELGYVGHWSSAEGSKNFIEEKVLPIVKNRNIDISIDNTGCSGMNNAFKVQNYMNSLKENGLKNKIIFKGNQTTSLGMWDSFFPGKHNLYAIASTENEMPTYPSCNEFLNKRCSGSLQNRDKGFCVNELSKLERLVCKRNSTFEWMLEPTEETRLKIVGYNDKNEEVDINDLSAIKFASKSKISSKDTGDMWFFSSKEKALLGVQEYNKSLDEDEKILKYWNELH
jgi:hypothetical protein